MNAMLWSYPEDIAGVDVTGFEVEACDGSIGKVGEVCDAAGKSYIVVSTGLWIFGRKVILPAGLLDRVDSAEETVHVSPSKDVIKDAPAFDGDPSAVYLDALCDYYLERPPEAGDVLATG